MTEAVAGVKRHPTRTPGAGRRWPIGMLLGLFTALAVGVGAGVPADVWILSQTAVTTGTIIAVNTQDHNTVRYEFLVGETRYQGVDRLQKDAPEASVGQVVSVTYAASNPEVSTIRSAAGDLVTGVAVSVVAGLIVSVITFWRITTRARK